MRDKETFIFCVEGETRDTFIPAKKMRKNFKALCPFHHERTPSLLISHLDYSYHCLSCGKKGQTVLRRIDGPMYKLVSKD